MMNIEVNWNLDRCGVCARSAEGMQIVKFCVLQKPVIMIRACWTNEATLSFSEYSIARGSLTV
jgi:hypothetical protein